MILIRRAEVADAAQIQRVYASVEAYSGTLQLPHPSVEMWRERLAARDVNDVLLVALVDGVVVATGGLHLEKNMRRRHVASIGLGVADSYVGRGIGSALLAELISFADNWLHILRLELTVYADNEAAVHLYQRFGFLIEGTLRAFALRNGEFVDTYTMARLHPKPPAVAQSQQ